MKYMESEHVIVKAYPENYSCAEQIATAIRTGHLWVGQMSTPKMLYLVFAKSPVSLGDEKSIIDDYLDREMVQNGS